MGETIFQANGAARDVLATEMGVVEFEAMTLLGGSACVALRIEVADVHESLRQLVRAIYDIAEGDTHATIAIVFQHRGLDGTGHRVVRLKQLDEFMGPRSTGGADQALLDTLTPLRESATDPRYDDVLRWARRWREAVQDFAWAESQKGDAA